MQVFREAARDGAEHTDEGTVHVSCYREFRLRTIEGSTVDVGLIEKRRRKEPDSDGLHSYYRTTSIGEDVLEHGVRELMREEWLLEEYGR